MPDLRPIASIRPVVGRPDEYDRAKRLLNKGRHPAFIGRQTFASCAKNGGVIFFVAQGQDVALGMVKTRRSVLLVLNVHPEWRSRGVGRLALAYLKPNFVRALESAAPFFERNGYSRIGTLKEGISLKTQVMVRTSLIGLAGRLKERLGSV